MSNLVNIRRELDTQISKHSVSYKSYADFLDKVKYNIICEVAIVMLIYIIILLVTFNMTPFFLLFDGAVELTTQLWWKYKAIDYTVLSIICTIILCMKYFKYEESRKIKDQPFADKPFIISDDLRHELNILYEQMNKKNPYRNKSTMKISELYDVFFEGIKHKKGALRAFFIDSHLCFAHQTSSTGVYMFLLYNASMYNHQRNIDRWC